MPLEIEAFYKGYQSQPGPPITLKPDYIEMDAMFEWGFKPEEWRSTHPQDKAEMMAYLSTKRSIEGYTSDWYRKNAEANSEKKS